MLEGPPPLGPGAPPDDRLQAFLGAHLDYCTTHLELVRLSETASPGARYRIGSYRFWHRHVEVLLAQTGVAPAEAGPLAHALLAPLAADLLHGLGPQAWPDHRRAVLALAAASVTAATAGRSPRAHPASAHGTARMGNLDPMTTSEPDVPTRHVDERAELLPEEQAAGSADPKAQAAAVLEESQDRTEHPDPDASTQTCRRASADTV